jgi:replicative DNA helicase
MCDTEVADREVIGSIECKPVENLEYVRKVFQALKVSCEEDKPFYSVRCPRCGLSSKLILKGPRKGKLSFDKPPDSQCPHSREEILSAAGLSSSDLYDDDPGDAVFPDVLLPQFLNASYPDVRLDEVAARWLWLGQVPWPLVTKQADLLRQVVRTLLLFFGRKVEGAYKDLCHRLATSSWPDTVLLDLIRETAVQVEQEKLEIKGLEEARQLGLHLSSFPDEVAATHEWLVEGVVVRNQPCLVGGVSKSLKTSIVLDLAISLASGKPFLGRYPVSRPVRVATFSGESGSATLEETFHRICRAKGIAEPLPGLQRCDVLPQLSDPQHLAALKAMLREFRADVVVIDPLYLCLLAGGKGKRANAASVFDMGPLFRSVCQACLEVGCTPILVHHTTKDIRPGKKPDLTHLAGAGVVEFARQWLLVNPRREYDPVTGRHWLWLAYGGSAGHSDLLAVNVVEGKMGEDFTGRTWQLTLLTEEQVKEADRREKVRAEQKEKSIEADQKVRGYAAQLKAAIIQLEKTPGAEVGRRRVRNLAKLNTANMAYAVEHLVKLGEISEIPADKECNFPQRLRRLRVA